MTGNLYSDRSPLRHNAPHDKNGRPPLQSKSILKNRNATFDTTSPRFPLDPTKYSDTEENCACSGFTYPFTMVGLGLVVDFLSRSIRILTPTHFCPLTGCLPFLSCPGKDSDEDSVIIDLMKRTCCRCVHVYRGCDGGNSSHFKLSRQIVIDCILALHR